MISRSHSKTYCARCWKERIRKVSGVSKKSGTSQCSQDLCLRHSPKRREDLMMVNVAQTAMGIEEMWVLQDIWSSVHCASDAAEERSRHIFVKRINGMKREYLKMPSSPCKKALQLTVQWSGPCVITVTLRSACFWHTAATSCFSSLFSWW